jgi:hypothetical protein
MKQENIDLPDSLARATIRNVSDLIARELRKMGAMDDNSLICALAHNVANILRKKDAYDSCMLLHGLETIRQRLTEDKAAHPDLLPVAIVMARVPSPYLRDAAYLAAKLKDVLDAHLAKGQPNEWKALVP